MTREELIEAMYNAAPEKIGINMAAALDVAIAELLKFSEDDVRLAYSGAYGDASIPQYSLVDAFLANRITHYAAKPDPAVEAVKTIYSAVHGNFDSDFPARVVAAVRAADGGTK